MVLAVWQRTIVDEFGNIIPNATITVRREVPGQPLADLKSDRDGLVNKLPNADLLYQCESYWWDLHEGCPSFKGEKWSSHHPKIDNKKQLQEKYGLKLVRGHHGEGFSTIPGVIHYGKSSGFQVINLAILMGARTILLVGFDMRAVNGNRYFTGKHPKKADHQQHAGLARAAREIAKAAPTVPKHVTILNATPDSALKCFPRVDLDTYLKQTQGT